MLYLNTLFQPFAVLLPFWQTVGLHLLLKTLATATSFVGCLSRCLSSCLSRYITRRPGFDLPQFEHFFILSACPFIFPPITQARFTTAYVYMNSMLFNVFFRAFFIVFPDYGLVKDGRPDLRLVHQLYWVVFVSFVLVFHSVLPLSFLVKGNFPEGTGPGRVCLGLARQQTQDNAKLTILQFMTPLLVAISNSYACWRVRRFLRDHCPRGRMSCIGVYRRNVITLKETSKLLYILCFSSFIDSVIQAVFPNLDKILEGKVLFWIWNIKGISFNEGLFLTLPLFLEIPFECKPPNERANFYVSAPKILLARSPTLTSHPLPIAPAFSDAPLPSKPSTSSGMTLHGAQDRNQGTSKQTGRILFVRSQSSLSQSPSPPPPSKSFSERKGSPKGGKSSNKLSIPSNKPRNDVGKKYRTTFYCKRHNQVERVESQK